MNEELLRLDDNLWNLITQRHGDKGGVYKLIAANKNGRIPINRFIATDELGILYIGKATSFIDRVIKLKKSILPTHTSQEHQCGIIYKSNPKIMSMFPYETLHIELSPTDDPENQEKISIATYRDLFGEVPPLNSF